MRYDGRGIKCWATGKVVYSEERHAKRAVSLSAHPLDAYPCIECGGFHIGRHRVEQAKKKKRRGGNTMSDNSAGTKVCERCGGSGNNRGGDCPWCSGTGVRTTGAVVGVLTMPPDPTPPYPERYIKPAMGHGASGLPLDPLSGLNPDPRDATIAGLTTDRDQLRLEVQRLKDLNFESQDLYAAIEAERDNLRENLGLSLRHNGEMASKLAALTAERDEARAEVERLKIKCQQQRRDCVEFAGELRVAEEDERKAAEQVAALVSMVDEQRARAESYLAVIEALRYELAGVVHCHAATIRSIVRLANAGLELPEVADNA